MLGTQSTIATTVAGAADSGNTTTHAPATLVADGGGVQSTAGPSNITNITPTNEASSSSKGGATAAIVIVFVIVLIGVAVFLVTKRKQTRGGAGIAAVLRMRTEDAQHGGRQAHIGHAAIEVIEMAGLNANGMLPDPGGGDYLQIVGTTTTTDADGAASKTVTIAKEAGMLWAVPTEEEGVRPCSLCRVSAMPYSSCV
jgi:hypothetical protein